MGVTSLGDRFSVALGAAADEPNSCPGDLAFAAEQVIVQWMRDEAQRLRKLSHNDPTAAVLSNVARRIEDGDA